MEVRKHRAGQGGSGTKGKGQAHVPPLSLVIPDFAISILASLSEIEHDNDTFPRGLRIVRKEIHTHTQGSG